MTPLQVAEEYEKYKAKEQAKVKEKDKPQASILTATKNALMVSKSYLEKDGVPKDEELMLQTRHGTQLAAPFDSRSNPSQVGEDGGGPAGARPQAPLPACFYRNHSEGSGYARRPPAGGLGRRKPMRDTSARPQEVLPARLFRKRVPPTGACLFHRRPPIGYLICFS